uniref:Subtilisin n=1 Tax=Odontella aurita TaxID=265563 RepID=A0A7S4MY21_9STRA|mmetsp:Transcript_39121/g.117610  ORF Transcript_39121/g.117610 Transcript_39121/m.117610 type:complete len:142 (+) Transcript_39121:133-558(+)
MKVVIVYALFLSILAGSSVRGTRVGHQGRALSVGPDHPVVEEQLATAQATWNDYFASSDIVFESFAYVETIHNECDLEDILDVMTDPDQVYISFALDSDHVSSTISLVSLTGAGADAALIEEYRAIVEANIAIGQDIFQVT